MSDSVVSVRETISGPLAVLLFGLGTHWLCLPSAFAEQQGPGPLAETSEAQAESQALQDSCDDESLARCDRRLNVARGRIEGLEAMLSGVQSSRPGYPAGTAGGDNNARNLQETLGAKMVKCITGGRDNNAWNLVDRLLALSAESSEQGIRVSLPQEELVFGFGTAELPSGEMPSLDRVAALLVEYPQLNALVEGHTDSAGPAATNIALSQERAEAVHQALVDRGVGPERLSAEGIGESRPVATNATSAGRQQNRRVEIYLTR